MHVITRYIYGRRNVVYGQMNDCLIVVRGRGLNAFLLCEALYKVMASRTPYLGSCSYGIST